MKFRKFGQVSLALAASLVLAFGTQSCNYDYTEAYVFVTGSQYNQIESFKENNETGQLTPAPPGPLSSGGTNPVRAVLLSGGRYVYVLNEGKATADSSGNLTWSGANIALFSVGGDGQLGYQTSYQSQGYGSIRLTFNATGSYLYVLDTYQPGSNPGVTPSSPTQSTSYPCYDSTYGVWRPAGDITAFSIDSATGRLFLVQNQQQQNSLGTPLSYFPIGCGAIDFHMVGSYLYTAEASDPATGDTQVIYPYLGNSNGQLVQVPGGIQPVTGAKSISYIGASQSNSYIYVLDSGNNVIYTYTSAGSNGQLSAVSGGAIPNDPSGAGMDALTTDSNNKFLYVANSLSPGLNQPGSEITAYTIVAGSGNLQLLSGEPFPTGSVPVCIFEDPSHQYIYTADAGSSTVTGSLIDPNTGILTPLRRGSSFATVGTPTWCLYSSNTD